MNVYVTVASLGRLVERGEPINVFNYIKHKGTVACISDLVAGEIRTLGRVPTANPAWNDDAPDPAGSNAPYRISNIGNGQRVELLRYIEVLEQCLGRKAQMEMLPLQAGDGPDTEASISELIAGWNYRPIVGVEKGVAQFVSWFRKHFGVDPP